MNLKQQIYHAIVDHHRRFGQVPQRDELRRNFQSDDREVVDGHLVQLAKEGLITLGTDNAGRIALAKNAARDATELGIQGAVNPKQSTFILGLGGVGLTLGDDAHALRVADDLMIDAGIQTGDIAILKPGVPSRGDIVAAIIDDRLVLRRFLVIQRLPHLLAENPGHPELRPAFDTHLQGVLCALLRVDFARKVSVRPRRKSMGHSASGQPLSLDQRFGFDSSRPEPFAARPPTARAKGRIPAKGASEKMSWPQPPSGVALNEPTGARFAAKTKKAPGAASFSRLRKTTRKS